MTRLQVAQTVKLLPHYTKCCCISSRDIKRGVIRKMHKWTTCVFFLTKLRKILHEDDMMTFNSNKMTQ